MAGVQKKGYKTDWLSHSKKEEMDESISALNATKTSKVQLFICIVVIVNDARL